VEILVVIRAFLTEYLLRRTASSVREPRLPLLPAVLLPKLAARGENHVRASRIAG
jgi:hypothetical protein